MHIQQEFTNLTANIHQYLNQKYSNYELFAEGYHKKRGTDKTSHGCSPQKEK
jgi:hypothetical protein